MKEAIIEGKIIESGIPAKLDEKNRDTFIIFFSNPPERLIDFANFVRDEYRNLRGIDLIISDKLDDSEDLCEGDAPTQYYRLEHERIPHLYVIDGIGKRDGEERILLEIARGEITKPDFRKFIKYLNRQA